MDPIPTEINEEDLQDLQKNAKFVDPNVVATPAKDQTKLYEQLPESREKETFFDINKQNINTNNPDKDLVIELNGQQQVLGGEDIEISEEFKELGATAVTLDGSGPIPEFNPMVGVFVLAGIFITIIIFALSKRNTDYILRLEKELENVKRNKY